MNEQIHPMNIMYATYPMAFHTPGGGEIQLMSYYKYINNGASRISLFDSWNPRFSEHKLVHYFSCVGGSVHFCNFIKGLGMPLVITSSLWITTETQQLYPVEEIRMQLELADKIVTNSDLESEALSETLNIPIDRFYTVYNGVDPAFLDKPSPDIFRQLHGIEYPFVLCVGNIEPRKNQAALAKAMQDLPSHRLVLIGHVRDMMYLDESIKAGLPNQVVYIGPLPHDSVVLRSAYQACDAFCLPSTLETPGLAALEAAAQGRPLAVTEVGSTKEYFGEAVAYLQPDQPDSIAKAIRQALQQTSSQKENLAKIGASFTWPKVVKRLQALYDQF
jgi:glycosyltransferase involved in cell wall biosynthesis